MNLYESINKNLSESTSKREELAKIVKEDFLDDIENFKDQIELEMENDENSQKAIYNNRQPLYAAPWMGLCILLRRSVPEASNEDIKNALRIMV